MAKYFKVNIEKKTVSNKNYRKVLYTTDQMQLVLMSIKPGSDIKKEIHPHTTQFIRVESGTGYAEIEGKRMNIGMDDALVVNAGSEHYIKNTGKTDLKLYTLYSPPEHNSGLVQKIRPDDDAEE